MAQVLMGYDKDGNIQRFDEDGDILSGTDTKMDEVIYSCLFRRCKRLKTCDLVSCYTKP